MTPNLQGGGSSAYRSQVAFFNVVSSSPPTLLGQTNCNWYEGNWTEGSSHTGNTAYWTLEQDNSGNITGTVTSSMPSCSQTTWTVTGSFDPTNPPRTIALTASNPNPPGSGTCQAATSVSDQLTLVGSWCTNGPGAWRSIFPGGKVNSGGSSFVRTVVLPDGEQTIFNTFAGQWGSSTLALFAASVHGANEELFGGRQVFETTPSNTPGTDNCWFTGSLVQPFTSVNGGHWNVQTYENSYWGVPNNTNYYYNDGVGFGPHAVGYYQKYRAAQGLPLPCTVTVPQQMWMSAGQTSAPAYGGPNTGNPNTLIVTIDSSQVIVSRGGVQLSNPFSFQ